MTVAFIQGGHECSLLFGMFEASSTAMRHIGGCLSSPKHGEFLWTKEFQQPQPLTASQFDLILASHGV